MKFDELDRRMRVYETLNDQFVLPGVHIVARLDGRGFTRLTKETHDFEKPFDSRFHEMMIETVEHLMTACGFHVRFGYVQSDEISLLFDLAEAPFQRKVRKLVSVLAGEASGKFSLRLGSVAAFDCRLSQLPTAADVVDYFRWRNEDAHRNALNAHVFWMLRGNGESPMQANDAMSGLSVADKNELLFQHGIQFNDLPLWQKRGTGLYWEEFERPAGNPQDGSEAVARRRRLNRDSELPMRDAFSNFLERIVAEGGPP